MHTFERHTLDNGLRVLLAPMPSTSAEMSRAVGRFSVPLKNMCSAKCAMPFVSRVS